MTDSIIKFHNVETGEVIEREMNAEELAQWEADKAEAAERKAEAEAKAAQKAALLERLGITEDEAKLLLA
jgi:regulator of protease activity HflC (stomatin/prohibitin superfamily)